MCNRHVRCISSVCFAPCRSELGRGSAVPDWQAGNYVIIRRHRRVHGRTVPHKDAKYWGGHQQHSGPSRSHAGTIRAASGESAHCAPSSFLHFSEVIFQIGHILSSRQGLTRPSGNSQFCFYPNRRAEHRRACEVCRMCPGTPSCHVSTKKKRVLNFNLIARYAVSGLKHGFLYHANCQVSVSMVC